MNDRFKLRAINMETKEITYIDNYYWFEENGVSEIDSNNTASGTFAEYWINQSTGLKDKNGKLIYEGDILKSYYENSDTGQIDFEYIPVGWDGEKCGFYIGLKYRSLIAEGDFISEEYEVVGNIYENKELLNG